MPLQENPGASQSLASLSPAASQGRAGPQISFAQGVQGALLCSEDLGGQN